MSISAINARNQFMPVVSLNDDAYPRLAAACASCRERGYRLALDLREALLEDHPEAARTLLADGW